MKEEEIVRVLEAISLNLGRIASALESYIATQRMVTTITKHHSRGRKSRK